jgi:uncharacterized protein (TIGR02996 family)
MIFLFPRRLAAAGRGRLAAMSTEQALFQSVLDAPDDDAPRLVYADWLEEHGQPERAEFIRVQIAREGEPEYSPRWRELEKRARALLKGHHREWGPAPDGLAWGPEFRRGFVESVCTTARAFADRPDELFARAPLRSLRIAMRNEVEDEFAEMFRSLEMRQALDQSSGAYRVLLARRFRSPEMRRLRHLYVTTLTRTEVAALAGSPHADGLTDLGFGNWSSQETSLREVFHSRRLARVESLLLDGFLIGGESVLNDLAASPLARQLVRLVVVRPWAPEEVRALVEAPALRNLRALRLFTHYFGRCPLPQIARTLAGSALLPRLHTLGLKGTRGGHRVGPRQGDDTARRLAHSPGAAGLRVLDLSDVLISDAGARALLESPHLENLWWLGIRRGGLSRPMLTALRRRFGRYVGTVSGL